VLYILLTLAVMHSYYLGCYALSPVASLTLLRCLVFFRCPILICLFTTVQKGGELFCHCIDRLY